MSVRLPKGVRARDIAVTMKFDTIKFALKNGHSMDKEEGGGKGGETTLLQRLQSGLKLHEKIDPDCSTWSVAEGNLVFNLNKRRETTWASLYEWVPHNDVLIDD